MNTPVTDAARAIARRDDDLFSWWPRRAQIPEILVLTAIVAVLGAGAICAFWLFVRVIL